MNDEDLRDLFAFGAMNSKSWHPSLDLKAHADFCYAVADAMIEAKYAEPEVEAEEIGIAAIKPKHKRGNDVPPITNIK